MSRSTRPIVGRFDPSRPTLGKYVSGYLVSIYLTLTAYLMVEHHLFSKWNLALAVAGLAVIQFVVQLIFFLHLGTETKPRWKLVVFLFMLLVVIILVYGSLWIMNNLNYHMLSPAQVNNYLQSQDGL